MNAGVVPQQPPIYAAPTSVSAAQSRRKFIRRGMIRARFRVGQTGVRFENQRQIGACTHGLKNRRDLLRAKGAIHTQRIYAQRVQRHRRRIRTAAEERPAGSLERHRGIDTGKSEHSFGRQDAGAELVQIGKRFKKNALCARRRARAESFAHTARRPRQI